MSADNVSKVLEVDAETKITYRIMTPADVPEAIDVLAKAFSCGEPTTGATSCSLRDWEKFCTMYVPRMAVEGNTLLAVEQHQKPAGGLCKLSSSSENEKIVGGFLNECYSNPDPVEIEEFLANADGDWTPVLSMVWQLEEGFNAAQKIASEPAEREIGKYFHLWMLGVLPEARGKGIAQKLTNLSLKWAKERGFEMAFAECTGKYSTAVLRNAGADKQNFIPYVEYKAKGENEKKDYTTLNQLSKKGHEGMSMMVKYLIEI